MSNKSPRLRKGDKIEIVWEDIISDATWLEDAEAAKKGTCTCHTIGYYVNRDTKVVRVSHCFNAEKQRSVDVIPRGCITRITKLIGV